MTSRSRTKRGAIGRCPCHRLLQCKPSCNPVVVAISGLLFWLRKLRETALRGVGGTGARHSPASVFPQASVCRVDYPVLAPHKGIKLKPRDQENLDEVKAMLNTRLEQWEMDIRPESQKI